MRLVLDIIKTHDGGYEGRVTLPGTAGRYDFAGILELLAILEQQVRPGGHEDVPPAGRESGADPGADPDGITGESGST
jgi:hypothetical protein